MITFVCLLCSPFTWCFRAICSGKVELPDLLFRIVVGIALQRTFNCRRRPSASRAPARAGIREMLLGRENIPLGMMLPKYSTRGVVGGASLRVQRLKDSANFPCT